MQDIVKEEEFLDKKIKPELQEIIKNIELEQKERRATGSYTDMEVIDFFIEENMLIEILGYSMGNRPKGLLYLTLKFLTYIIKIVKSADILAMRGNHEALFQLL